MIIFWVFLGVFELISFWVFWEALCWVLGPQRPVALFVAHRMNCEPGKYGGETDHRQGGLEKHHPGIPMELGLEEAFIGQKVQGSSWSVSPSGFPPAHPRLSFLKLSWPHNPLKFSAVDTTNLPSQLYHPQLFFYEKSSSFSIMLWNPNRNSFTFLLLKFHLSFKELNPSPIVPCQIPSATLLRAFLCKAQSASISLFLSVFLPFQILLVWTKPPPHSECTSLRIL